MLFQVVVLIVGVVAGLAARALLVRLILLKFRRDVQRLNTATTSPCSRAIPTTTSRTRWGKIVEHEDFYEDTARLVALDQKLRELGSRGSLAPASTGSLRR